MTLSETRNLAIEFERRIQQTYPNFNVKEKLTSDVIYSMLNEYQNTYFKTLILADDQDKSGTRQQRFIDDSISTFITYAEIQPTAKNNPKEDDYHSYFDIPDGYYAYIRSTSKLSKSYKSDDELTKNYPTVPNIQVKNGEDQNALVTVYNHGIIKRPLLTQHNNLFSVLHDEYTSIASICLHYYRRPQTFGLETACELPLRCFDDLVQGAVDMYLTNYKFKLAGLGSQKSQPRKQAREEEAEQ